MAFNINFQNTILQKPKDISEVSILNFKTNYDSINNLFGNGWYEGAVISMTGYRGCGKTTFWLQILEEYSTQMETAFLSNEENIEQLKLKCDRLNVKNVNIANINSLETILEIMKTHKMVVVDCFQGIVSELKPKEIISKLVTQAKEFKCCLAIILQMTKDLREKGVSEIGHLCDQTIKLVSGVGSFFEMDNPVIFDGSSKNRNGRTGYLVLNNGSRGFDLDNPWNIDLVSDLPRQAVKKV